MLCLLCMTDQVLSNGAMAECYILKVLQSFRQLLEALLKEVKLQQL
jgi:hypothetical protein